MDTVVKPLIRKLIVDFLASIFILKLLLNDRDLQRKTMGAVCWKSFCAVFYQYLFHFSYCILLPVIRGRVIIPLKLTMDAERQANMNIRSEAFLKKSLFIFLATVSIVLAMLCFQKTAFYHHRLDHKKLSEEWKFVRDFTLWTFTFMYVLVLAVISVIRRANPVRIGPKVKYGIDGGFVLICLAISKYFDDLPSVILFLSLCFHILPVAQLLFDAENYGVFDTLLALCLETALHLHRYPKLAPFAVIFLSFGMHVVKHYAERRMPERNRPEENRPQGGE